MKDVIIRNVLSKYSDRYGLDKFQYSFGCRARAERGEAARAPGASLRRGAEAPAVPEQSGDAPLRRGGAQAPPGGSREGNGR